jgi:hypothetical protein
MGEKRKKVTKENLLEIRMASSQASQELKNLLKRPDASKILAEKQEQIIRELDKESLEMLDISLGVKKPQSTETGQS